MPCPSPRRPRRGGVRRGGIACASYALMMLGAPLSFADDFSEFRIPPNRALLWNASLGAAAQGGDVSQPGAQNSSGDLNGNASSAFQWFSDSDPAFTSLAAGFAVRGDRSHSTAENDFFSPTATTINTTENSNRSMNESWTLQLSHRLYPWAPPLGFEAGVGGSGAYSQRWASAHLDGIDVQPGSTSQSVLSTSAEGWRYRTVASGSLSAGWGRVRNATGIYDALVLEQRIRATGALKRPLSADARRRLAELLYARGGFDTVRERPGRSLWREIERILSDDGALGDNGFDPFSVLRGEEPHLGESVRLTEDGVPISPVTRLTGSFLGVRLVGSTANIIDRFDGSTFQQTIVDGAPSPPNTSSISARSTQHQDLAEGGLVGEFHRPLGSPWQLDGAGSAFAGLRAEDNHLSLDAQLALAWLAADRWTASTGGRYRLRDDDRTTGATGGDTWSWRMDLAVIYYLEDHVGLQLTANGGQDWRRGEVDAAALSPESHFFSRSYGATLSLNYRFSGWFQMPGFFPAAGAAAR